MGSGVPRGATITAQPVALKSGIVSDTVGKLGKSARRFAEATAISLIVPDRAAPAMPEYPSMIMETRPVPTSATAWEGPPVYGTSSSLIPASCCSNSPARWVSRPIPVVA